MDPAPAGLRMPAEWEPHEATWIAWPHRRDDWPGKFAAIPWVYAEIVRHLHQSERVRILVDDARAERRVQRMLLRAGVDVKQIDFFQVPTDRVWTRDYGPLFVCERQASGERGALAPCSPVILDWHFNAWAKYPDWHLDNAVPACVARRLGCPIVQPTHEGRPVVLEGGSIDVNGQGLLLTTEECLLSPIQARNPSLPRPALERLLAQYLGISKVLWLGRGIAGDDTHGHVDDLARFVNPSTIVAAVAGDPADENYGALEENRQRLTTMTGLAGRRFEIVPLPLPGPVVFAGQRLPASYANFYIANDRVLVPTFNDANDRTALGILSDLFPGRLVVGIHAVDLVWGLGTLHCLTQQQPAER
jgi:agmatine deiminase